MGAFINIEDIKTEQGNLIFPLVDFEINGNEIKFSTVYRKLVRGIFYGIYIKQKYELSDEQMNTETLCRLRMEFVENAFFQGNIADTNNEIDSKKVFVPCRNQMSEEERSKHLLNHRL